MCLLFIQTAQKQYLTFVINFSAKVFVFVHSHNDIAFVYPREICINFAISINQLSISHCLSFIESRYQRPLLCQNFRILFKPHSAELKKEECAKWRNLHFSLARLFREIQNGFRPKHSQHDDKSNIDTGRRILTGNNAVWDTANWKPRDEATCTYFTKSAHPRQSQCKDLVMWRFQWEENYKQPKTLKFSARKTSKENSVVCNCFILIRMNWRIKIQKFIERTKWMRKRGYLNNSVTAIKVSEPEICTSKCQAIAFPNLSKLSLQISFERKRSLPTLANSSTSWKKKIVIYL